MGIDEDGQFYHGYRDHRRVPLAQGSVFLGGFEHIKRSDARPTGTELALLEYLDGRVPRGSTIMIPPSISNRYFPGVFEDIRSVSFLGANELKAREAFIKAYYDGTFGELVPGRDVDSVLDDLSVDYVVVPPRTELDDDVRRFTSFEAVDFFVELGDPEQIAFRDLAGDEFSAWAFDGHEQERIGGGQFSVPDDMDPSRPVLEFVIDVAAVANIGEETSARIVITYAGGSAGATTNVVTDLLLPEGTLKGERIIIRRLVGATVEAGTTYSFVISRLPSAPEDRLSQDILLTRLSVKYWPESFVPIGDTGFFMYER